MRILVFLSVAVLGACTISPEKIKPQALVSFGNKNVKRFYNSHPVPTHRMDVYEVSARVLKYNLRRRLKQMEADVSLAKFNKYKRDLLPTLQARSSQSYREKDDLNDTYSVATGEYNAASTVGSERISRTDTLELSWNVLDFGVGYLSAKQQANAYLRTREERRKAIFALLESTYTNYWYVVAGEKYEKIAMQLARDIDTALKKLSTDDLADALPEESLTRQKNLLRNKRTVNESLRSIREKKIELADLMGLPAGTPFQVHAHKELVPVINLSSNQVDQQLFAFNPDMRIAAYREKIDLAESKIAFYRLFPRLSLDIGYNNNTDKYLLHKQYTSAGATVSWNLFNLLNAYQQRKLGVVQRKLAKQSRLSSGVAVLTAARIKELLYRNALERYADDVHLHMVEKQLSNTMRSMEEIDIASFIDVVEARVGELRSGLERVESYALLMRYAFSIANAFSANEFAYDLDAISLPALKRNLQVEVGTMPISWIGAGGKTPRIADTHVRSEILRVRSLWQEERNKGVAEKGDNRFNPNMIARKRKQTPVSKPPQAALAPAKPINRKRPREVVPEPAFHRSLASKYKAKPRAAVPAKKQPIPDSQGDLGL